MGQVMLAFGFLLWLIVWIGLAFYAVLSAHRRCWWAVGLCKFLSGLYIVIGITVMYQIPGSIQ